MSKIILYDINDKMCNEWYKKFKHFSEVDIQNIEFKDVNSKFVVTAGNSYGVMSGGIDLAVRNYFGIWIQDIIQESIFFNGNKYIPIGDFIVIKTNDPSKQYLVYAPTMEKPQRIDKNNIYRVMYNILDRGYKMDGTIAICGLGTNTGGLSHEVVADTMYDAYKTYINKLEKK